MSILAEIVARKREEVAQRRQREPANRLEAALAGAPPVRDFLAALRDPPGVRLIAELKRASPSAGTLHQAGTLLDLAAQYERHGAACISVLTDGPFFHGSLADLEEVRRRVRLPLLRKDFILDRYQVLEARRAGADAVLLIAEILTDEELVGLRREIEGLGMAALVECYTGANLARVVAAGAALVGINNRDLHTFQTTIEHTLRLAGQVPRDHLLVSESGIRTGEEVRRLAAAGVKAMLVGETLLRSSDLAATFTDLLGSAVIPPSRR